MTTIDTLKLKLNLVMDREEEIVKTIRFLMLEYEQLQDDKQLLEDMILHQFTTIERKKEQCYK